MGTGTRERRQGHSLRGASLRFQRCPSDLQTWAERDRRESFLPKRPLQCNTPPSFAFLGLFLLSSPDLFPPARIAFVVSPAPLPPPAPAAPLTHVLSTLFFFFSLAFSSFLVNFAACEQPDCLIKIEHFTFKPIYGCASLAKETFAKQTNATLSLGCSGYSGIQVNRCIRRSHFNILELTLNSSRASVQSCDFYLGSVFRRANERVKPVDCRLVPR